MNICVCFYRVALKDVKCSVNWMLPAKSEFEGARLHDTCAALCSIMAAVGVAADSGKDSLSMAVRASRIPLDTTPHSTAFQMKTAVTDTTVKAPGSVMVSVYAPVGDIRSKVTPDLNCCNPDTGEPKGTFKMLDLL